MRRGHCEACAAGVRAPQLSVASPPSPHAARACDGAPRAADGTPRSPCGPVGKAGRCGEHLHAEGTEQLATVRRDRLAHLLLLEVLLVAVIVQNVEQVRILPRGPARDHSQVRTHLGPLRRAEEACHVLPEQLMSLGAPRCAVRGGLCTCGLNLLLLDHLVVAPLLGLCGRRRRPSVRLRHGREELLLQPVRLKHFGFDDAQLSICLRVRQQLIGRHLRIVLGVQEAHAHVRHMVLAALAEVSHAPDLRWPPRETLDLGPHEVATLVVGDHSRHSGLGCFSRSGRHIRVGHSSRKVQRRGL